VCEKWLKDRKGRVPFLLKGIVFGADGRVLTPWFTRKKSGRLYRYYLPARDSKEHAGAPGFRGLPAAELEAAVLEQLRGLLRAPSMVADVVAQAVQLDPTLGRGPGHGGHYPARSDLGPTLPGRAATHRAAPGREGDSLPARH